jgi:hypothetical protein
LTGPSDAAVEQAGEDNDQQRKLNPEKSDSNHNEYQHKSRARLSTRHESCQHPGGFLTHRELAFQFCNVCY